jgi:hypothetical protein
VSDHQTILVRLDPDPDPDARIAAIRAWLLDHEFVEECPGEEGLWPGPRWRVATRYPEQRLPAHCSVEFKREWLVHTAMGSTEAPSCRQCGRQATEEYDHLEDWVNPWWLERVEPVFTCAGCGWSAPAGDWPGLFAMVAGAPAVTFNNWPPLRAGFMQTIRELLGGRTRLVEAHS